MPKNTTEPAFQLSTTRRLHFYRADHYQTLVQALRGAASSPNGLTLVDENDGERFCRYSEIYEGARRRAAALRRRGLGRGERVVIVLNTSFEFVEVFFGVMLAGGVPVPAYPPVAMSRMDRYSQLLAHVIGVTGARLLVTDRTIGATLGALYGLCPTLQRMLRVSALEDDPERWGTVEPDPEDIGFIQCSSGSTSAPKAVTLPHSALMANLRGMAHNFALSDDDVGVAWLPLYHDMGLIGGLLQCIGQAIPLVLIPPAQFIMDPGCWWRALSRHQGTITAAPNFAFGLTLRRVDDEALRQLDLSCLRILLCGAEPIQPELIRRFCEKMVLAGMDPRAFFPAYGLAESCVAVTSSLPLEGLHVDRVSKSALADARCPQALPAVGLDSTEVVCVGRPIPRTQVTVHGKDGRQLPPRHVGEIWVRGPSLMRGYFSNAEATAEALQDGALRTGDLGYLVGQRLFIVGRKKNMLIVRGKNYYAEDIEAVVEQLAGVRKGNAVAYGVFDERQGCDRLHIALETRLRDPQERAALEQQVRRLVAEEVGLFPEQVLLLAPGTLPKTTSGKKQRLQCRDDVVDGTIFRQRKGEARAATWVMLRSQLGALWHLMKRSLAST